MSSPLMALPGAVAAGGPDSGVAAHYGGLYTEQRSLAEGEGFVDLSHRDVVRIAGPERLTWLHNLTTQWFLDLPPGQATTALILSPQGHIEHAFAGHDDGLGDEGAFIAHTEPGTGEALVGYLERMKFMTRVEVSLEADLCAMWRPAGGGAGKVDFIQRDQLTTYADALGPACGLWAYEALRIARGEPRLGLDTDHKTIPNEVAWIDTAVHLDKGCYRGQETVARVHNLGRPPRRLVMLHLDGSENTLPTQGATLLAGEREVGLVGTSARHHQEGPIALALIKRNVDIDAVLLADGLIATQQVIVDPEVGLHFRARLS